MSREQIRRVQRLAARPLSPRGGIAVAIAPILGLALSLAGCAGGDPASDADVVAPVASTPGAVSRAPLLPPVPEPAASKPATDSTWSTSSPPLEYDHLYSEDEQAKLQADLMAAAARALSN